MFIPGNHDGFADYAFGDIEILDEAMHVTARGLRLPVLHSDKFDGVIRTTAGWRIWATTSTNWRRGSALLHQPW